MTLPRRGSIVLLEPDPVTVGHEQAKRRPAVVVTHPEFATHLRFAMLAVVPLTTTALDTPYARIAPTPRNGLKKSSYALFDQIRSVDPRRIRRALGPIESVELESIDRSLRQFLSL